MILTQQKSRPFLYGGRGWLFVRVLWRDDDPRKVKCVALESRVFALHKRLNLAGNLICEARCIIPKVPHKEALSNFHKGVRQVADFL